ncbi:unnamed protein product [Cutaneotrichosporon oleaginosum]
MFLGSLDRKSSPSQNNDKAEEAQWHSKDPKDGYEAAAWWCGGGGGEGLWVRTERAEGRGSSVEQGRMWRREQWITLGAGAPWLRRAGSQAQSSCKYPVLRDGH